MEEKKEGKCCRGEQGIMGPARHCGSSKALWVHQSADIGDKGPINYGHIGPELKQEKL